MNRCPYCHRRNALVRTRLPDVPLMEVRCRTPECDLPLLVLDLPDPAPRCIRTPAPTIHPVLGPVILDRATGT